MSNSRKPAKNNKYRTGYLHSVVWFNRRDEWIKNHRTRDGHLTCSLCEAPMTHRTVELHHIDYSGVLFRDGKWFSDEKDSDIIALHPRCHEWIHLLLDRDVALRRMRDRRQANVLAVVRLRKKLLRLISEGQDDD